MDGLIQGNERKVGGTFIDIISKCSEPIACIRDWNILWYDSNKWRGNKTSMFNLHLGHQILNSCNLLDLGSRGPHFTWEKQHDKILIKERVDKVAVTIPWNELFPNAYVENLISAGFDHIPILLSLHKTYRSRRKPFSFEWMWTTHPECTKVIKKEWIDKRIYQVDNHIHQRLESLIPALRQ